MIALLKKRGPFPQRADREPLKAAIAAKHAKEQRVVEARATVDRLRSVVDQADEAERTAADARRKANDFRREWARNGCRYSEGLELQKLEDQAAAAAEAARRATRNADAVRRELDSAESAARSAEFDARVADDAITGAISGIVAEEARPLLEQFEKVADEYRALRARVKGVRLSLARPPHLWNKMNPSAAGETVILDSLDRAHIESWDKELDERPRGTEKEFIERLMSPWLARAADLRQDPDA